MNLTSLPPCPPAFKSINPYLQRAREMEIVDPVISYWCAFHAAQTCMSVGHNEVESREFLMRLLDLLEHAKSKLSENDAITNNLAATAYVENFALKIFDGADKEDREGLSTRFLAAACFLEVLQSLTNQPEPDIMQKVKYSKWKAGSIAKAIREGTGPQQSWEVVPSPGSASSSEAIGKLLTIDTNRRGSQPMSGTEKMPDDDWPKELGTTSMNKLPSPISGSNTNPFSNNSSNKPSPFPSTVFPPTQQADNLASVGPVPSDFSARNLDSSHLSNFPHSLSTAIDPSQPVQQTFYSTPSINTSSNQNGHNQNTLSGNTSSTADSHDHAMGSSIDPLKISKAQKYAKWAISALNFDDISTAKSQLQVALDTLNSL